MPPAGPEAALRQLPGGPAGPGERHPRAEDGTPVPAAQTGGRLHTVHRREPRSGSELTSRVLSRCPDPD